MLLIKRMFKNTKFKLSGRTSFNICSSDLSIRAEMNTNEFALKQHKTHTDRNLNRQCPHFSTQGLLYFARNNFDDVPMIVNLSA